MSVRFPLHDDKGTVTTFVELEASSSLLGSLWDITGTFQKVEEGNEVGSEKVMIFGVYVDGKSIKRSQQGIQDEIKLIGRMVAEKTCTVSLNGRELRIITKK